MWEKRKEKIKKTKAKEKEKRKTKNGKKRKDEVIKKRKNDITRKIKKEQVNKNKEKKKKKNSSSNISELWNGSGRMQIPSWKNTSCNYANDVIVIRIVTGASSAELITINFFLSKMNSEKQPSSSILLVLH